MRVLAIDPGGHVGVACYDAQGGFLGREGFRAFEQTPAELYDVLDNWIEWAEIVVVEGFIITGRRARDSNLTIEMIGVVKYLAARWNRRVVEQKPGDAPRFVTNDMLKNLGWWTTGSDHARSATKHLVLYLARTGVLREELLLSDAEGGTE